MRRRRTALVKLVNNFYGCWLWFAAVLAAWFLYNLIG